MEEQENIRRIALEVLMEVLEKDAYVNKVLGEALDKYAYLEKNRRAFLTRLVEGTVERCIELDYIIDFFSKVKVKKQKPLIRNLLRMSVYQLKYMDSVPASAVCNEAVKLVRSRGFGPLSGFVNGVLRTIARKPDPVKLLDEKEDPAGYLQVVYSTPRWMVEQWLEDYGYEQTRAILSAFYGEHLLTIRTNRSRCTPEQLRERLEREGVKVVPAGWSGDRRTPESGGECPSENDHAVRDGDGRRSVCGFQMDYAFDISGIDRLERLEAFQEGLFYVQDLGSMLVTEWALEGIDGLREPEGVRQEVPGKKKSEDARQGTGTVGRRSPEGVRQETTGKRESEDGRQETAGKREPLYVIDVCAAPGGKCTHMAETLGSGGFVDARDLTEDKVALIEENIQALELANISARQQDARVFEPESEERADILICDLPCSGLGVMGKKTDIRYHMTPEKQRELAGLQRQILETVHGYVKPGGVMIYSTCTIGKTENEDNVRWFLEQYPEFSLVDMKQLFPGRENHDGFFLAKLVRLNY